MAATCLDIITYALRLSKVLASGDTPTADETADGMVALQSFYDMLVDGGMFGRLTDAYLTEDEVAMEGHRYYVPAGVTLTAPTSEYASAEGDIRQPRDLALYEALSGSTRNVKIYDRTDWVEMTGLLSSSTAPLSARGAFGLAAAFACSGSFAAMFTNDIPPDVRMLARQFLGNISAKQGSTQDLIAPDYF